MTERATSERGQSRAKVAGLGLALGGSLRISRVLLNHNTYSTSTF